MASKRTASHITAIARDAHISGTRARSHRCCSCSAIPEGSCGTVVMSHLLPTTQMSCRPRSWASGTARIVARGIHGGRGPPRQVAGVTPRPAMSGTLGGVEDYTNKYRGEQVEVE